MASKRADVLLVERGMFDSRSKARAAIEAGTVTADGVAVVKPSMLIDAAAELAAVPAHPWVGRGGVKLDHALSLWPITVAGRTVLDIGASTGGFTQVCLARGAAHVFAVDVGREQFHASLRNEPRLTLLEGVDARALGPAQIPHRPDLVVCDASFIGLAKVIPAALGLAAPGADLVALVKPQFEVGPERVGKGGVVRDAVARQAALDGVTTWLEAQGWPVNATTESAILGGDGNVEFLVWATKRP